MKLPVDALLEQLHQVSVQHSRAYAAWEEKIREASIHMQTCWALEEQESSLLIALQALGVSIPDAGTYTESDLTDFEEAF